MSCICSCLVREWLRLLLTSTSVISTSSPSFFLSYHCLFAAIHLQVWTPLLICDDLHLLTALPPSYFDTHLLPALNFDIKWRKYFICSRGDITQVRENNSFDRQLLWPWVDFLVGENLNLLLQPQEESKNGLPLYRIRQGGGGGAEWGEKLEK